MQIGPYTLPNRLIAAPMAGVTDRPFRMLVKRLGAGMAVSEMVASNPTLWGTDKTVRRGDHQGEPGPIVVQIAGADPHMLADAARYNVANGAQIIDINMGCPAKKVCNVAAGSALLRDEALVAQILHAVVAAVAVPVTLKFRTGWAPDQKNALAIAKIAEDAGIQSLAIHGRTRACAYVGAVEYDTILQVKNAVSLPVVANGDIDSPQKAAFVLQKTGADALMIGRAAQGRPWIFREIDYYLRTGRELAPPTIEEIADIVRGHLADLYAFYGEYTGCRVARKHIAWYVKTLPQADSFRRHMNTLDSTALQFAAVDQYFLSLSARQHTAPHVA